ncbi:hypothetical protein [Clostridium puniceum]|uniref:hypothetical protein n=1 Tax=Clostridium puniceum TaxID=29367 RepID=UPI0013013971|nr:hypothetical protein [Clostridium puniceum]
MKNHFILKLIELYCYVSTAVSRIRQSIESLFNQIDEKVKLKNVSKVRSLKSVLTHA